MTTGCQQGNFDPTTLPPQYCPGPVTEIRGLDLSGLSGGTYNSREIQPGDSLSLTIVSGAEDEVPEAWPVVVSEDGVANVPLVGPIQLAGYDLPAAQAVVRDTSIERGVFRQPSVSITVKGRDSNRVTVMGAVKKPGAYELPIAGCDLLAALLAAGGLSSEADTMVEIRRGRESDPRGESELQIARTSAESEGVDPRGDTSLRVDLVAAARGEIVPTQLRDGDVVRVIERPRRFVQVLGLVNKPNQFEVPA
ncbi:MAG TPA: SLBB domain-containing protein, partial [Pirellulaceae bacterium]